MTAFASGPIVILTALDIEYAAVRAHLTDVIPRLHDAGTVFETGRLPGSERPVVLALTGPGNVGAGVLGERAIAMFAPAALLFAGIAGSLRRGVEVGDVVVATRVVAYHGAREDRSGHHARPRAWEASHVLEQAARQAARGGEWPSEIHFKPVAAGEVVLNTPSSPLARQLHDNYDDAVAIEMESAGAAAAAHLNQGLPMLAVRGISDSIHGIKEDSERDGWPLIAARRAAAVAAAVLVHLPHAGPGSTPALPVAGAPGPLTPAVQHNQASGNGVVFGVQGGNQTVIR
ncbi:MAG: 5'-methylthioadenosine/S-adenosylhomocysteine nucleosidase [Actinoplanes sp.]